MPSPPVALAQQAWPSSPQGAQVPALHLVPGAVQVPLPGFDPQQGFCAFVSLVAGVGGMQGIDCRSALWFTVWRV